MVGIYKITNTVSQKVYIGQSVNMLSRWRQHMDSIMQHTGFTENEPEEEVKEEDSFFTQIEEVIATLSPEKNTGIWCYGSRIRSNQKIVAHAEARGFKAIELHSKNNDDFSLTSEQRRVMDIIIHTGMVPYEHDFVVVNSALLRGFSLQDRRFTLLIVNSLNTVAQEQAGRMVFPIPAHSKLTQKPLMKSISIDGLH